MMPEAYVAHTIAGRTRIRIDECKNDFSYFRKLKEALKDASLVKGLKTHPETGSVVVYHTGSVAEIGKQAEEKQVFALREAPSKLRPRGTWRSDEIKRAIQRKEQEWDEDVQAWTDGEMDLKTAKALGLLSLALFQFRRGVFLPAGLVLAQQALRAVKK